MNIICKKAESNDFEIRRIQLFQCMFYSSTLINKEDSTFSSLSPRTPI